MENKFKLTKEQNVLVAKRNIVDLNQKRGCKMIIGSHVNFGVEQLLGCAKQV